MFEYVRPLLPIAKTIFDNKNFNKDLSNYLITAISGHEKIISDEILDNFKIPVYKDIKCRSIMLNYILGKSEPKYKLYDRIISADYDELQFDLDNNIRIDLTEEEFIKNLLEIYEVDAVFKRSIFREYDGRKIIVIELDNIDKGGIIGCVICGSNHKRNRYKCSINEGGIFIGCHSIKSSGLKYLKIYKRILRLINPITRRPYHNFVDDLIPKLHFDDFSNDEKFNIISYNEPYVKSLDLDKNGSLLDRTIIIQSYLGTGKSTSFMNIPELKKFDTKILVLSPRMIFAKSITNEFLRQGVYIDCYTDFKSNRDNSNREFQNNTRFVCQMESLHKLKNNYKFDYLIIDEVESCLNQFYSLETMKDNIHQNLIIFEKLVKNSKHLICLDAFVSNRTINVISELRSNIDKINIIHNEFLPPERQAIILEMDKIKNENDRTVLKLKTFIKTLIDKLSQGYNCYLVCHSKKKLVEEIIPSIKIAIELGTLPDTFKYISYSSDTSNSQKKKDFENVNDTWSKVNLVMTTTCITVGVNFSENHFDYLFVYGGIGGSCVRDIFQSMMRVRQLKQNVMYYCLNPTPCYNYQNQNKKSILNTIEDRYKLIQKYCNDTSGRRTKWIEENYIHCRLEATTGQYNYHYLFREYLRYCGYLIKNDDIHDEKYSGKYNKVYDKLKDVCTENKYEFDEIVEISESYLKYCLNNNLIDKLQYFQYDPRYDYSEIIRKTIINMWDKLLNSQLDEYESLILKKYQFLQNFKDFDKIEEDDGDIIGSFAIAFNEYVQKDNIIHKWFENLKIQKSNIVYIDNDSEMIYSKDKLGYSKYQLVINALDLLNIDSCKSLLKNDIVITQDQIEKLQKDNLDLLLSEYNILFDKKFKSKILSKDKKWINKNKIWLFDSIFYDWCGTNLKRSNKRNQIRLDNGKRKDVYLFMLVPIKHMSIIYHYIKP